MTCWCQNKLFLRYQHSSWFIRFRAFDIVKDSICIVSFLLVLWTLFFFVVNPCGSYSTFVGADLEYPNLLRHDRSTWSGLRYFNFEPSLKLWWRPPWDFDGSKILVDLWEFQGFSRFLSFEISKLRAFVGVYIFTIISNMNYC